MPATLLPPTPKPRRADRLRYRTPRTALKAVPCPPLLPVSAHHDFLVPNPRPDLTIDLRTLRMLEN